MLEWLGAVVVDHVFGYILDQSGLGEKLHSKLEKQPAKEAFQLSFTRTIDYFKTQRPQLMGNEIFTQSFQDLRCARILAQLLLRDRQYDVDALARLWTDVLYTGPSEEHTKALSSFHPLARDFLEHLDKELRCEDALKDIHDSQAIERTASGIEAISHTLLEHYNPPKISNADLGGLCQQYCKRLYDQWKMLDFKGIQYSDISRPVSIPLTEVFILPDVLVGVPEYETLERDDSGRDQDYRKEDQKRKQDHERAPYPDQNRRRVVRKQVIVERKDLQAILAQHKRLVVLGDPGSGKSTLLRYLLLVLAENSTRFRQEFPQLASKTQSLIPLYVPLTAYAEAWTTHTIEERSLKDFLPKHLRFVGLDTYASLLQEYLEQGRAILLLDGLDEIPDASLRMQIVRQIELFTGMYAENRFIVTSRIVGYKDAPLAHEYQAFTLADFNEQQIKTFTEKWCPAYERWVNQVENSQTLQNAATDEAEKLFQATHLNEGVKRLAVNPLLLTILALIQRQGIELPSHRVELFDLCVTTLLETWIKAKGTIGTTRFSKQELIKILRPLAFWMHEQATIGAILEEDLLEQIVNQLLDRKIAQHEEEAQHIAEQFLQTVRGKAGILIERGKHRYGFLHLTFEEFFAAWELVIRKKERNAFIKQHLHNSRWQVVILLAIGYIGIIQSDEDEVTELIEEVILKAESPFEHYLHRDLLFACLCLADDIGVSVTCRHAIVEKCVYLYLTSPFDSLRATFLTTLKAWRNTPIATEAINVLLNILIHQGLLNTRTANLSQIVSRSSISIKENFTAYYDQCIQQNKTSHLKIFNINVMSLLHRIDHITFSNSAYASIEYILMAFADPDARVRQGAAQSLGQVGAGQPQVVEALLHALADPDARVRQGAAQSLGQVGAGQPQVVEALLHALADSDVDVRYTAAQALGQVGAGQPQVVEALLHALANPNQQSIQRDVTKVLATLPIDPIATGQFIENLLLKYSLNADKQFIADPFTDNLLFALQSIVSEI